MSDEIKVPMGYRYATYDVYCAAPENARMVRHTRPGTGWMCESDYITPPITTDAYEFAVYESIVEAQEYIPDTKINSNPDAQAWAKEFMRMYEAKGRPTLDEVWMLSWFASAMMAMHDHVVSKLVIKDSTDRSMQAQPEKPQITAPLPTRYARCSRAYWERCREDERIVSLLGCWNQPSNDFQYSINACRLPEWIECGPPDGYEICTREEWYDAGVNAKQRYNLDCGVWTNLYHTDAALAFYARKIE